MSRLLVTLLALLALAPASAAAATSDGYEDYQYGLDRYLDCIAQAGPGTVATASDHVACANTLAMDWTDGGQVRRLPLCLKNRTVEFATGENHDPIRTEVNCLEEYLGTHITIALPRVTIPPAL